MRKSVILAVAAAVILAAPAAAQGTAMDWLRASVEPVSAGLAGAGYAAPGSSAAAFLRNPAMPVLQEEKLGAAVGMALFPSGDAMRNMLSAGVSYRMGKFSVHAGYAGGKYPEVSLASDGGGASGTFKPGNMVVGGGFGLAFTPSLSLGANVRYASEQLSPKVSLTAISADVAALYRAGALGVTAGVFGLGPKVSGSGNSSYALPASAKIAGNYLLALGENSLSLSADADYYFNSNVGFSAGAEFTLKEMAYVRAGFTYGSVGKDFSAAAVPTHFAFGAGARLMGVGVNLSAMVMPGAGLALCGGISYSL